MAYFDFLLNQWILNKLTPTQVDSAVTKNYITAAEAETIKATPKAT